MLLYNLPQCMYVCTYIISILYSTFYHNRASNGGAAISVFYNYLILCNVTIANNTESAVQVRYHLQMLFSYACMYSS